MKKRVMRRHFSWRESKAVHDSHEKNHVDAVLGEPAGEDYAPRGEEVFTETFRHMAREIENRKYDRYANARRATTINYMLVELRQEWSE